MPYTQQELEANEHYQSIKSRDEVKYHSEYNAARSKWLAEGGNLNDSFRNSDDVIQLYEDPQTGERYQSDNQFLRCMIYQRRYRTNVDTKDILNRQFEEL